MPTDSLQALLRSQQSVMNMHLPKCSDLMGIILSKKMCSPQAPLDSEAQRINTEGAVLRVLMHSWYTLSKRLPIYAHILYSSSVLP